MAMSYLFSTGLHSPGTPAAHSGIDDEQCVKYREMDHLVVLPNGKVTFALRKLLKTNDPSYPVFADGLDIFQTVLYEQPNSFLEATPLEAAYAWTLSCNAALNKCLVFGMQRFDASCGELLEGRIFPGESNTEFNDLTKLKSGCLYYTTNRHPLADLFIITDGGKELVLIDITGGSDRAAQQKAERLVAWLNLQHSTIKDTFGMMVHGVVLAPCVTEQSTEERTEQGGTLSVVRGKDARDLLGGLDQVFRWF